MSGSADDAWHDEFKFGDWAFKAWEISTLRLCETVDYFSGSDLPSSLRTLHERFLFIFSSPDNTELQLTLALANDVVEEAICFSEREAKQCWLERRIWIPGITESLVADDDLVQIVTQAVDLVGYHEQVHEGPFFAAIGLWCIGEWRRFQGSANNQHAGWALQQVGIAAIEAGWRHGYALGWAGGKGSLSARNKKAADARHESNRTNKIKGRALWESRTWKVQADAERAISLECNITKEVAGRWVREFKRVAKE